jgi:lipid-A-disaccharide synthase
MQMTDRSCLIVAGESSGDSHAADLVGALNARLQGAFRFWGSGGEAMREAGVEILMDVERLAAVGPREALSNWRGYWTLFRKLQTEARARRPELAILVDFPEFNLRLASRLKRMGIPVCQYIGPQVWAWRSSRVKQIRRFVDLMLVILPFEEDYYRKRGVKAVYVGNPTAARLRGIRRPDKVAGGPFVVALLPGSRRREVERILPVQLEAARFVAQRVPSRFLVVRAPAVEESLLANLIRMDAGSNSREARVEIWTKGAPAALSQADCAIVKSGTSTLEAALAGVPFAMMYRLSGWSRLLLRPWMRTDTYCLANLVAGKRIVPEFVQEDARAEDIGKFVVRMIEEPEAADRMRRELRAVAQRLGDSDGPDRAAAEIESFLGQRVKRRG